MNECMDEWNKNEIEEKEKKVRKNPKECSAVKLRGKEDDQTNKPDKQAKRSEWEISMKANYHQCTVWVNEWKWK